jgi:putative oxidoreductase
MRHLGLLIARFIFGSYLAVHGAQKLFGTFNGSGPDKTGAFFEQIGISPSKPMAYLAGASELAGGVLTATGIAYPVGPIIIAGTMAVASTTHREKGALAQDGGFELPLTNMAMAIALMSSGSGALRLGPHAPKSLLRFSLVFGAVLAGVSIYQILSPKNRPVASEEDTDASDEAEVTLLRA